MNWIVPPPVLKHYLEEEIKIFTEQIERENNSNKEDFDELIGLISKSLEAALGVQVTVYGSFATRLCLKESDIDVVVIPAEGDTSQPVDLLEKIDNIIKTLDFVSETKFIRTAFIPVIKVSCNEHYKSKRIDITLQDGNHNGLNCVNIIRHYMGTARVKIRAIRRAETAGLRSEDFHIFKQPIRHIPGWAKQLWTHPHDSRLPAEGIHVQTA